MTEPTKKKHERTNEWMNIGTHLSIKSAIFNIGQKGEKFSNLQNENGPLNRYGIKKERKRESEKLGQNLMSLCGILKREWQWL